MIAQYITFSVYILTKLLLVLSSESCVYKDFNGFNAINIYLNRFRSYYFLNIDMSRLFTNINHDDARRHDSTVHYIFCDNVRRHDSSKLVNISTWSILGLY